MQFDVLSILKMENGSERIDVSAKGETTFLNNISNARFENF